MMLSRYTCPSEEAGRGPTKTTCTWENLRAGTGMACTGAAGCLTLPLWHCWHARHMAATSLPTPFHTKRAVSMRFVARMPGCATLWMAWKTAGLSSSGTSGIIMPHATSHSRLAPFTCTVLTDREEDLVACSVLVGRHPVERHASRQLHIRHAPRPARK
jgi:hypothetical protein